MSIEVLLLIVVGLVVPCAAARRWLGGANLSAFDHATGERFLRGDAPRADIAAVIESLGGIPNGLRGVPWWCQRNAARRKQMDQVFAGRWPIRPDSVESSTPPNAWRSGMAIRLHRG